MLRDFWQGKKVVVTGGAGMIGTVLVGDLLALGAQVVVLDNFSRGRTKVPGAGYVDGDAGDYGTCQHIFHGAYAVFNLAAAVAGVEYNQDHHPGMFAANIRLQVEPLRAAGACGVDRLLQTSSVCVYAPEHQSPSIEGLGQRGEPHPANAGYAWAKRMGERYAQWTAGTGLHTVIVRPTNAYGRLDYFDERAHVIPALIRKALAADVLEVNGTGREKREFIHADDVAAGMIAALTYGRAGEAYNLGTNAETCVTIATLARMVTAACGVPDKPAVFSSHYDSGDPGRWTDCRKARQELGWRHKVGLAGGLRDVVDWYRGCNP